ncbi:recombinase family protein [Pedobacter kyungheensis]|uniref:recombinase family protein n=1 Tax=Pedobacter kyungheensis TaxID=1069985 RepID=UPI0009E41233
MVDQISRVKSERPYFNELLSFRLKRDTLTIWRLDRLGRTTVKLIEFVTQHVESGMHFRSIIENINISTASDKLIFIFAA